MLRVDEPGPGLCSAEEHWDCTLLSLHALAARGRFEDRVFTAATLVGIERYHSRIQATFAPVDWGGLIVRAAWSPSCGGAGVDLEVQASATSAGLLHDLEVMVQSRWRRTDRPATATVRRVVPRDSRSAALSYDGRESAGALSGLVNLAMIDSPRFHTVTAPGTDDGLCYVEMVLPNDVARFIRQESSEPGSPLPEPMAFTYGLFGHDFEKGVVFRARLRGYWIDFKTCTRNPAELYQQFVNEPPPLGP
jgi:hypothetical protein